MSEEKPLLRDDKGQFIRTQPLCRKDYMANYNKKYYRNNKKKLLAYNKEWKKTPKGRKCVARSEKTLNAKLRHKRYAQGTGKLMTVLNQHRSIAKEKLIINLFSSEEWSSLKELSKGYCGYCGENVGEDKLTIDHKYPVRKAYYDYLYALGDGNFIEFPRVYTIDDIEPLCNRCNSSKGNKCEVES